MSSGAIALNPSDDLLSKIKARYAQTGAPQSSEETLQPDEQAAGEYRPSLKAKAADRQVSSTDPSQQQPWSEELPGGMSQYHVPGVPQDTGGGHPTRNRLLKAAALLAPVAIAGAVGGGPAAGGAAEGVEGAFQRQQQLGLQERGQQRQIEQMRINEEMARERIAEAYGLGQQRIQAQRDIAAGRDTTAEDRITAQRDIAAGRDRTAEDRITAQKGIAAGRETGQNFRLGYDAQGNPLPEGSLSLPVRAQMQQRNAAGDRSANPVDQRPVTDAEGNTLGWANVPRGKPGFVPVSAVPGLGAALGASSQAGGGANPPSAPGAPTAPPSIPAKPGALEQRMAKTADYTVGLIDDASVMVRNAQAQLGPGSGRWNDFVSGKIGLKNVSFTGIKTQLGMLDSAMTLAHSQGRVSTAIYDTFKQLYGNVAQDPANILEAFRVGRRAMNQVVAEMGGRPRPEPSYQQNRKTGEWRIKANASAGQ